MKHSIGLTLLWLGLAVMPGAAQQRTDELRCRVRSVVEWEIQGPRIRTEIVPEKLRSSPFFFTSRPAKTYREEAPPPRLQKRRMEVYDRKGRLIIYTAYKDDGGILYSDRNTYDQRDRLIGTETIHSEHVYLPDRQLYSYDQKGRLSDVKGYDSRGQLLGGHVYVYDSGDNLIEEKSYSSGKNLVYSNHLKRHKYDERGNRISTETFTHKGTDVIPDEFGVGYQTEVVKADSERRPIEVEFRKIDQSVASTSFSRYDRRNNTIEQTERFADGRIKRNVRFAYVFDRHGNWVKQVRREWTAEGVGSVFGPVERTIRKIEYYPNPCAK